MKALGRGSLASFIKIALEIIWIVLWLGAIGLGVAVLGYGLAATGVYGGWLPKDLFAQSGAGSPQAGFTLDSPQLALPALASAAVVVAGGLVIVQRLKALFASFTSGEPFRAENAMHLRVIWVTLAVIELLRMGLGMAAGALIAAFGQPGEAMLRVEMNIAVSTWIAILILIVLAEVFREGARLKRDQDLTI
ncbi:MAG: DUF2975 domain-containing protein [Caulobacterales bacterium]